MQDINNKLAELVNLLTALFTQQTDVLHELQDISGTLNAINNKLK